MIKSVLPGSPYDDFKVVLRNKNSYFHYNIIQQNLLILKRSIIVLLSPFLYGSYHL